MLINSSFRKVILGACALVCTHSYVRAQTDMDYDMMAKNLFCSGFTYTHSSWTNYWEGTMKRDNQNLGKVSTQMLAYMGNYGISKKLNLLFGLPYVKTKATGGTLAGMKGLQDLSLFVKYKALSQKLGPGNLTVIGVGGFSFPTTNYVADHLPLAIGLRSKNIIGRIIADYQVGKFFATGSGTYMYRSNITIDRTSYYTTEMHLTNKVEMPDASSYNIRAGYRTKMIRAEAFFNRFVTLGGFDITRNNMPFPSNRMNASTAGIGFRYVPKFLPNLTINLEGSQTIAGRNVGESTSISGGAFYILNFNRKPTSQN